MTAGNAKRNERRAGSRAACIRFWIGRGTQRTGSCHEPGSGGGDESAIAELISINLRHAGYEVVVSTTADEALQQVDKVLPDLVVLDWMLPGQSGLQLAKRWRTQARTRELPIIMLTARAEESDKISGLDAGADDYLTKPFSTHELMARIRAVLRRKAPEALDAAVEVGLLSWTRPRDASRAMGRRSASARRSFACCTSS
jgi:two-component system phosphate regulon response regulator PhoB